MKFKIELEAVSPKEKAMTPIMKINISSENASPESVGETLYRASYLVSQLDLKIKEMTQ